MLLWQTDITRILLYAAKISHKGSVQDYYIGALSKSSVRDIYCLVGCFVHQHAISRAPSQCSLLSVLCNLIKSWHVQAAQSNKYLLPVVIQAHQWHFVQALLLSDAHPITDLCP